MFLVAFLYRRRLTSKLSLISLAGLSAVGFAFTENIVYYARALVYGSMTASSGDVTAAVASLVQMRGLWTSFGHPLFKAYIEAAIAHANERERRGGLSRRLRIISGAAAVLAVAATPNFLFVQRGPYSKEGMDYSQVADIVTAHAAPGDCLIMDNTTTWLPGPIRPLISARPAAYATLVDPGRGMRGALAQSLAPEHSPRLE